MIDTSTQDNGTDHSGWPGELQDLIDAADRSMYDAVSDTATSRLDRAVVDVSNAANHSRIWLLTAGALALLGGARGRRAALRGAQAIALASAVTNLGLKPLARRQRPSGLAPAQSRRVRRPESTSFPSGHAASAFAFAGDLCGHAIGRQGTRSATIGRRKG